MPRQPAFSLIAPAAALALLAGCAAPHHTQVRAEVQVAAPAAPSVVSVYVDPPMVQPEPVLVDVAPPPMLVEVPPPPPMPQAVWVGGYWGWQGRWVWCAGHWMTPPQSGYAWTQPYYEHRDGAVVFVAGHWAAPGVAFVPPPPSLHLSLQISLDGGARPVGPSGVFVPPPPGSRPGLVVPAPVGTPPAVVVSAPPVVNVGMRVTNNNINTTNINNHNVTNITNVTNVTVVAPPGATANGQAYQGNIPAQAHLAAALPAIVQARAPRPAHPAPMTAGAGQTPPSQAQPAMHAPDLPQPAHAAAPVMPPPQHASLPAAQPAPANPTPPGANAHPPAWPAAPHAEAPAPRAEPPVHAMPAQPQAQHHDAAHDKPHAETPHPPAPAASHPAAKTAHDEAHREHHPRDKDEPHHGDEAR